MAGVGTGEMRNQLVRHKPGSLVQENDGPRSGDNEHVELEVQWRQPVSVCVRCI